MNVYVIQNVKRENLKFGGSIYIHRALEEKQNDEINNARREIVKARKNKEVTEHVFDVKERAKRTYEALKNGTRNEMYGYEKTGTEEDLKTLLNSSIIKNTNVFDDMDLLLGDEIIFIPFFGYYKHDLIDENEIKFSLIVQEEKDYRIGTLIPQKILTDAIEYKNLLSTKKGMVSGWL